jgi:hypothetical protein
MLGVNMPVALQALVAFGLAFSIAVAFAGVVGLVRSWWARRAAAGRV